MEEKKKSTASFPISAKIYKTVSELISAKPRCEIHDEKNYFFDPVKSVLLCGICAVEGNYKKSDLLVIKEIEAQAKKVLDKEGATLSNSPTSEE